MTRVPTRQTNNLVSLPGIYLKNTFTSLCFTSGNKFKTTSIKRGDCEVKFVGASIILFTVAGNRLVWTSCKRGPTGNAQT